LITAINPKYWEGYMVVEDAFLYKFDVKTPPTAQVDFSCDRSTCGIDASCIAIDKVDQVTKAYLLFTPSPMTEAKLDEYKTNADSYVGKGKMQAFDPKAWAKAGSKGQEHSLKPELIGQHVPEWILYKQCKEALSSLLGVAMDQQLFATMSAAYAGVPAPSPDQPAPGRLGILAHKLKQKEGAVFVMYDHIGITQELNGYRNGAFAKIEAFLARLDNFRISNQQKLTIHEKIQELRVGFENNFITDAESKAEIQDMHRRARLGAEPIFPDDSAQMKRFKMQSNNAYTHPSREQWEAANADKVAAFDEAYAKDMQALPEAARAAAKEHWQKKYLSKLDVAEMKTFMDSLDRVIDSANATAADRVDDHLKWVKSLQLINAFASYDKNNDVNGHAFEGESALCTFGMTGTPKAAAQVEAWIKEVKSSENNIYLRGYYMNQLELEKAANEAMPKIQEMAASVKAIDEIHGPTFLATTKKTIDVFRKNRLGLR
jgi:hypothetical protein